MQAAEVCQRCGSTDLLIQEMNYGRSELSQVLKCKTCGSETLIPWRETIPVKEERQEKRDWRVLVE